MKRRAFAWPHIFRFLYAKLDGNTWMFAKFLHQWYWKFLTRNGLKRYIQQNIMFIIHLLMLFINFISILNIIRTNAIVLCERVFYKRKFTFYQCLLEKVTSWNILLNENHRYPFVSLLITLYWSRNFSINKIAKVMQFQVWR